MRIIKINAGALQLTTFIIAVIAVLLVSFILVVHSHKQFVNQSQFVITAIKQANIGITHVLQNEHRINDTIRLNLLDNSCKNVKVYSNYWGIFKKVISIASIKKKEFKKVALIGAKQDQKNRVALYVNDNNKPLVLVGNTKIKGLSFLPKQGAKTGNIAGNTYYGSRLIYGLTNTSIKLPVVISNISKNIKLLNSTSTTLRQDQFLNTDNTKIYTNSFFSPLKMVYSKSTINLKDISITGHVFIQSKRKIKVFPSALLNDVVLMAPKIEIMTNTIGRLQAIATKQIIVGKHVNLNYPSALVVSNKEKTVLENNIVIGKHTTVQGVVANLSKEVPDNFKTQILLEEKAILKGEMYNTQNTELRGKVYGTVYSNNFVANQSGSVYQNHIYNAVIDVNKLPEEYVGLLFNKSKKGVLKWLY